MIETMLVYIILLKTKLVSFHNFSEYIDNCFLNSGDNRLLLDLEFWNCNINEINDIVNDYIFHEKIIPDYSILGSILIEKLKGKYNENKLNIEEFGSSTYKVWQLLPDQISMTEPFITLCYADDCLSYGDASRTRELYEKAFSYQW